MWKTGRYYNKTVETGDRKTANEFVLTRPTFEPWTQS